MSWVARALICLILGTPLAAQAQAPAWTVLEESTVGFTAYQSGAPVDGLFQTFKAEVLFAEENLEQSRIAVTVDIASVDSQSNDRDQTIRSANLFNVAEWPNGRFVSERITKTGAGMFEAHGKLTLRDVTREVTLPFQLTVDQDPIDVQRWRANAWGDLKIMRLDYGIGQGLWQDTSVVGNEVLIRINITAWRPKE
ncbi:MAG: YceI family protein [Pseudomonadota bacterium]